MEKAQSPAEGWDDAKKMPKKKTQNSLVRAWPYVAAQAVAKDWANGTGTEHNVKMCKFRNVEMCRFVNV